MERLLWDLNMPPSRANSEMSPAHLVLVGLFPRESFVCLFLKKKVVSVCFVGKFCLSVFSGVSLSVV